MKEDGDEKTNRWIGCPVEHEYIKEDRKAGKAERKKTKASDRSKYKKTDHEKYLRSVEKDRDAKSSKHDWLEGRVLSIMPQGVIVDWQGEIFRCVLKGVLKKERTHAKNLVAVGDFVLFEKTAEVEGIIAQIKPRRTILSRADNLSRRKEQLIAVNIDQVIISVSVVNPPLKTAIIDRYIIAAQKGGMEPLIAINKMDLLEGDEENPLVEEEREHYLEAVKAYEAIGIRVISLSTETGLGIEALKVAMKDKASVFSGPSGVGKSSLINRVTGLSLRIGEVVEKTKKGSHTTTTAQLIPLDEGGWCIDTPGIKSFGVWDIGRGDLDLYFPEIHAFGLQCKFADCTHAEEDDCAVLDALEEGKLSFLRYESYQSLRQSIGEEHVRR